MDELIEGLPHCGPRIGIMYYMGLQIGATWRVVMIDLCGHVDAACH